MSEYKDGSTAASRIAARLRPSNDTKHAQTVVTHGSGPTRAVTSIHHSGGQGGLAGAENGGNYPRHGESK
jgi:hypothetical protein